ncbi:ComEC/Rec2 family competence protein [Hymenobacter latericus]|uniref:ComEC/Rec2 family competence protein n=1 Tax=Hymenobacter sp. YIM 151858-1 TaxID=2987688 RepID=UPI00222641F3|nr:ComEC/Rec2 family competence protein [Hymenobacter sp. YIM 151858-1]UYZ60925.1 ComEC family competence protein [Hymenobacter sp. YIM 151858-1]
MAIRSTTIPWATHPAVRLVLALVLGIVIWFYWGASLPDLLPWLAAGVVLYLGANGWATKAGTSGAHDAAGLLALGVLVLAGTTVAQQATESRRPEHLYHQGPIEFYRAVVDDYTVVRPNTYATTLRVSAVRVAGQWRPALGGVRVSVPRYEAGVQEPRYGQVWLVRGAPAPAKAPLNPGEFDYRRYLGYHQIYHQQFVHPDQYRVLAVQPPSWLRHYSMQAAKQLEGVFRRYVTAKREFAIADALVLGLKDEVDSDTKQAYANTGTTHIMAVSGLQVGLLFGVLQLILGRFFGNTRGFRVWSAGVGLLVIWAYAFLTGLSASVLRAAVMFSFVAVARAMGRQSNMYNTLAVAAFCLLLYDPYLLVDVGFQLSFLAVLSIVYLQPRIAGWVDAQEWTARKIRPWQPRWQRKLLGGAGWVLDAVWQAVALSLAAQVATFPLGLFYFHQFPLSFLLSNLVAVPLSSLALYVGLGLQAVAFLAEGASQLTGLQALLWLPRGLGWVFEKLIWLFNEYIVWVGEAMPGALVTGIHLTPPQTWLLYLLIALLLAFAAWRRLVWLGAATVVLLGFSGSRVQADRRIAADTRLIIYSIPRRSALGLHEGASALIVTPDSLPLNHTEQTYRVLPGLIERGNRQVRYVAGWPPHLAVRHLGPGGPVLLSWHGRRVAFVSQRLWQGQRPVPVDVVVLRRNARVWPEQLRDTFGPRALVVFDSSCRSWYVARLLPQLQAAGMRVHDVTAQGAVVQRVGAASSGG